MLSIKAMREDSTRRCSGRWEVWPRRVCCRIRPSCSMRRWRLLSGGLKARPIAWRVVTPPTRAGCAKGSCWKRGKRRSASRSSTPRRRPRRFTRGFARRWPVSWQRVRGHERLVDAFDRVVRRGRLGHAYLFAGPPGVGKRLFAEELARALLCESPARTRLEACDLCPACRQVAAGTHPDLFIAGKPEESLELPIDVMRDLCRSFSLKSARDRGKVVILDDADDLNEESANCFLKTLEEPPPRSVLLLIGTSPDRQLATIRSRCQVVHFAPLAGELVAELLRAQGAEDPALIERLVRLSGGSPGRARALADPALWEFRRQMLGQLS